MLRSSFTALAIVGLLAGCASPSSSSGASESEVAEAEYRLPGVSETLLVADDEGHASVVRLGDPTTAAPLESGARIVAGRSFDGRFWLLDEAGALVIVDPAGGVPARQDLGLTAPADLEIENVHSAWISTGTKLLHVDPTAGATLATLDFAGTREARGVKRVDDRLYVQLVGRERERGAIAVVDLTSARLESVLELEVPASGGGTEIGYDPGGAMIVDAVHRKLLLTARGFRPSNTGMVMRIDLAQRTLDPWFFRAGAGFQGGLAPGPDASTLFIGYHTSTPVASTHLFSYRIAEDGELVGTSAGTLLDAFEVVDDYPSNASGSLFALPVSCPAGFCLGGKGVSFIDTKTATPHPRLPEATIGVRASFVLFL